MKNPHFHIMLTTLGAEQLQVKGLNVHFPNSMELPGSDDAIRGSVLYIFFSREKFHNALDILIDNKIKPISIIWNY